MLERVDMMKVKIKCPHCDSDITRYPGRFYICPLCNGIIDPELYSKTTKYRDPTGEQYKEYTYDTKLWETMLSRRRKKLFGEKIYAMNDRVSYWITMICCILGLLAMLTVEIIPSDSTFNNIVGRVSFNSVLFFLIYGLICLIKNKRAYYYPALFYSDEEENATVAIRYFVSSEYFCFAKILVYANEREKPPNIHFVEVKRSSVQRAYYMSTPTWYDYRFSYTNEKGQNKHFQIPVIFSEAQLMKLFPIKEIDKSFIMRKKYDVKTKQIVRFWKL